MKCPTKKLSMECFSFCTHPAILPAYLSAWYIRTSPRCRLTVSRVCTISSIELISIGGIRHGRQRYTTDESDVTLRISLSAHGARPDMIQRYAADPPASCGASKNMFLALRCPHRSGWLSVSHIHGKRWVRSQCEVRDRTD